MSETGVLTPGLSDRVLPQNGGNADRDADAIASAVFGSSTTERQPSRKRVVVDTTVDLPPNASDLRPAGSIETGVPLPDSSVVASSYPLLHDYDPTGMADPAKPANIRIWKGKHGRDGGVKRGSIRALGATEEDFERHIAEFEADLGLEETGGRYVYQAANAEGVFVSGGMGELNLPVRKITANVKLHTSLPPEVTAALTALTSSVSDLKTQLAVQTARAEEQAKALAASAATVSPGGSLTETLIKTLVEKAMAPPPPPPPPPPRDPMMDALLTAAISNLTKPQQPSGPASSIKETLEVFTTVGNVMSKMNPGVPSENPWVKGAGILVEGIGNVAELIAMGKKPADAIKESREKMAGQFAGADVPPPAAAPAPGPRMAWVPQGGAPPTPGQPVRQPGERAGASSAPHFGPSPSSTRFDGPDTPGAQASGAGGPPPENRAKAPISNGAAPVRETSLAPVNGVAHSNKPKEVSVNPLDSLDQAIRSATSTPESVADLFMQLVVEKKIPRMILGRLVAVKPAAYPAWADTLGYAEWAVEPNLDKLTKALAIVRQRTMQQAAS